MSKSGHKTPDFLSAVTSEDSTPHYARSTKESRNKEVKKNVASWIQKNRISPLRSPRLCEDYHQVTNRNLESKVGVYDHKPNLSTGSQSSNKERINIHQTLKDCQDVFEERLKSEINNYKQKLSERDLEIERLRCNNRSNRLELDNKDLKQLLSEREKEIEELKETIENDKEVYRKHLLSKHKEIEKLKSNLNNDHRDCKKRLSVKDKEIEKLKGMVEVGNNRQKPKMFKYEEDKKKQSNIIKELEKQVKQNREEHDDLKRRKVEYEDKLQEYLEVILTSRDEKSRLTSELQKRVTENKKMRETSMEQQEKIKEHETTLEKMRMIVEKYKRINKSIMESNVEKEDRNRDLEIKLKHVEMMKEEISRRFEEISKDLQASEKDYKLLRIEFEKGNKRIKQLKEKECGINDLQMQLDAKMEENNRLTQHISRYSDRVTQLEEEIRNIKHLSAQERMFTEEKILQAELADNKLQIENLSRECEKQRRTGEKSEHEMTELKQVVQKKTNEVEELNKKLKEFSKKCSALHKDKEEAKANINTLTDALNEKKRDIESLTNQLKRSETHVSVLKSRIDDMQKINTDAVDQSKSLFQHENASLKLAYEQATFEIKGLSKQLTNEKRDKENAENQIDSLSNTLFHKEKKLESVQNKLARSEEDVLILSKDIKDIEASKRLADEKLQRLQTENASLKSALSNATNEIDNLNKGTNLQKYKTDAEHKTSTLMNALREKDAENEALREQLARAEKNVSILSKEVKDMQASKRHVAEEKLQSLQTENDSLKSALSKATNEIEDLLNKDTNQQKYKTDVEHKTRTLVNALQDKENEIKDLSKQLARSEENVSILSKDIKNIQESKCQDSDEKLQSIQTENASLKSALSKAKNEIDDLWNKCTNLQKYKSDTELEIGTLLNLVEEKETEIETLHQHLARSEKNVSILSKDIKDIQGSKRQAADEKVQSLQTENASIKLELTKAATEIDAFRNKCTMLQKYKTDTEHTINTLLNAVKEKETEIETLNKQLARKNKELSKDKENAENQKNRQSKALDEKEKEIEIMLNDIARYKDKIWTLTKTVEDIKGSKSQAADENIKDLQKKIGSLESEMNDLSYKYKCLQKDKESAEFTINKLLRNVQEKEKEISSLIEDLAKANENEDREKYAASANSIQKLTDENASLRSKLSQLSHETEKKVSALTKEIKSLQKSKGTSSEEYNARKLYEENEFLKAQLDRTSRSYEQLRKDYNEVKREKDHALNRLSSVAGEKLRNNNPGIADLSDENRPINLGEKFSQLYDDQWTDAIEHLEEMGFSETDGIRRLLDILKAVFDECVKLSDTHFNKLKELTGTSHLPSDQLKKLKDLRKATAVHSVAKIKQVVNDYMSTAFSKEKAACQTYIDRSIELCWLMSVQDPPVVIDFIAVHGQAIDDKILRKFTKTGSKIDFLVWPVIRLHKNGPLLQKGVVQPI